LIVSRFKTRAVFALGFAKNDRTTLNEDEEAMFKKAAKLVRDGRRCIGEEGGLAVPTVSPMQALRLWASERRLPTAAPPAPFRKRPSFVTREGRQECDDTQRI